MGIGDGDGKGRGWREFLMKKKLNNIFKEQT